MNHKMSLNVSDISLNAGACLDQATIAFIHHASSPISTRNNEFSSGPSQGRRSKGTKIDYKLVSVSLKTDRKVGRELPDDRLFSETAHGLLKLVWPHRIP